MCIRDRAYEQLQNQIEEYRKGAVLIHLCFDNDEWKIIFIQRSTYDGVHSCLLYTSPSPRDRTRSRMPSSA